MASLLRVDVLISSLSRVRAFQTSTSSSGNHTESAPTSSSSSSSAASASSSCSSAKRVKPVRSNRIPLHVLVLVICIALFPAISAADSGALPVASLVRGPHRDVSRRREESDRQLLRSFEELSAGTMAASGRNAEDMLRDAIDTANSQRKTITVHLTSDVLLTKPLPSLGFNAGVAVKGSCAGSAKCVIDGRHKFAVFSGGFNCFISLEQVTVRNAVNGVHTGGCAVTARRVTFINNVARTTGGGAVVK
ncbi:unnamed protein product [Closterium sp. NIES-54]